MSAIIALSDLQPVLENFFISILIHEKFSSIASQASNTRRLFMIASLRFL
jgi:hypothetical protein